MAGTVTGTADLDRRQDLAVLARSADVATLGAALEVHRAGTYGGGAVHVPKRPAHAEEAE